MAVVLPVRLRACPGFIGSQSTPFCYAPPCGDPGRKTENTQKSRQRNRTAENVPPSKRDGDNVTEMLSQKTIGELLSVCYLLIFCRAVSIALALNYKF